MKKRITALTLVIILILSTASFAQPALDLEYIKSLTQIIQQNYPFEIKDDQLTEGALKGIFGSLDPYSAYYTKEEYKKLTEDLSGEISEAGIGVRIMEQDGNIVITELIKGNPAASSGLKKGDILISADDKDLKTLSIDEASSLIRGKIASKVKIGVKREGVKETLFFHITRKPIVIFPVEWKKIDQYTGYIKLSEFNSNMLKQTKEALKEFDKAGIKNIVFDVRDNPGGYLSSVIEVLRILVPKGPIVHVKNSDKSIQTYSSQANRAPYNLIVLTNENSASASEIFAGAVQDRKVGKVIGTKTYGKGTVQNIIPVDKGGAIKLTVAEYFTPNMKKVNGVGIIPDIEVNAIYKEGTDQILEKALNYFKNK